MRSRVGMKPRLQQPVSYRGVLILLSACILILAACGGGGTTSGGGGLSGGSGASSSNVIKIGALATLTGPFAALGADGMRGVDLAVSEFNGKIGNKQIQVTKESSDATPNVARDA